MRMITTMDTTTTDGVRSVSTYVSDPKGLTQTEISRIQSALHRAFPNFTQKTTFK